MVSNIWNTDRTSLDWTIPTHEVAGLKFKYDQFNNLIKKRLNCFFTSEPKTLEWIDSFKKGETLVDIGANIGLYTLYAAKKGINVHAFEPHAGSYADLITNIQINGFDNVKAYPFAIMDKNSVDELSIYSLAPGQSRNDFGIKDQRARHYVAGFTLDHIRVKPEHIKIDVDGLEAKVIAGIKRSFENVKSMLVETNSIKTLKPLIARGFEIDESMTYKFNDTEANYILRRQF